MPALTRPKQIDTLMEQASQALAATDYFKAERLALKALVTARQAEDFERMTKIVLPLQEARRQRRQLAFDVGSITIVDEPRGEQIDVKTGCYLFQPPQVGADARRFRVAAIERGIPVAVVCREPLTQLRLCPVVAIAPGVTVREKIDPPSDPSAPDLPWLIEAMEALGDAAIDELDAELTTIKRIDALLGRLDAIPDHEGLHHALAEACHEIVRSGEIPSASKGRPRSRRAR